MNNDQHFSMMALSSGYGSASFTEDTIASLVVELCPGAAVHPSCYSYSATSMRHMQQKWPLTGTRSLLVTRRWLSTASWPALWWQCNHHSGNSFHHWRMSSLVGHGWYNNYDAVMESMPDTMSSCSHTR